jgi:hypothetical protein
LNSRSGRDARWQRSINRKKMPQVRSAFTVYEPVGRQVRFSNYTNIADKRGLPGDFLFWPEGQGWRTGAHAATMNDIIADEVEGSGPN